MTICLYSVLNLLLILLQSIKPYYFIFAYECLVKLKQWNAWLLYVHMKREKRRECLAYRARQLLRAGTESSRVATSWDIRSIIMKTIATNLTF